MTQERKITLAQVITRLDWGGSPDILRVLCTYLDPAVHDITLISGPTAHMTAKTADFLRAFKSRYVEIPQLKRDIDPVCDLAAFRALHQIFRRERFDIVHTHTAKAGLLGRIAARMAGCRAVVHTPHGHNFYGYFGPVMTKAIIVAERFAARYCDKIIALTDLEKKDMVSLRIAQDNKIEVLYQGLELDGYVRADSARERMRRSFGVVDDSPVIGMIGRLEPVKGPDHLVEAAALIARSRPDARFVLAGEGGMRGTLEARAAALGLKDEIIFTGWRDDVPGILAALDVFVLPSLNEAVGMALVEAQAAGVASVASRVGGIPEVLKDGETGILVPPADPAALAAAITVLLADPAKRKKMAVAAQAFVAGKFRAEEMATKTAQLYSEMLSSA